MIREQGKNHINFLKKEEIIINKFLKVGIKVKMGEPGGGGEERWEK